VSAETVKGACFDRYLFSFIRTEFRTENYRQVSVSQWFDFFNAGGKRGGQGRDRTVELPIFSRWQ
jgi:hypothetical protein